MEIKFRVQLRLFTTCKCVLFQAFQVFYVVHKEAGFDYAINVHVSEFLMLMLPLDGPRETDEDISCFTFVATSTIKLWRRFIFRVM